VNNKDYNYRKREPTMPRLSEGRRKPLMRM